MMPIVPGVWMWPGMIPILHFPGEMTPGVLGPMSGTGLPCEERLDLDHVEVGMPSVMQTTSVDPGVGRTP